MIALTLALALQAADPNSFAYLARCTAAEAVVSEGLRRSALRHGLDLSASQAGMAKFHAGVAAREETARVRENLTDAEVERLRAAAEQAFEGQSVADALAVMDACESAHELMD